MLTHFSILARRIPWTGEPGGLQSMELERVGLDRATTIHTHTQNCGKSLWLEWFCIVIGERYTQQILERTENKAL